MRHTLMHAAPQPPQEVEVENTDLAFCNETYSGAILENMVCAGLPMGGADACQVSPLGKPVGESVT